MGDTGIANRFPAKTSVANVNIVETVERHRPCDKGQSSWDPSTNSKRDNAVSADQQSFSMWRFGSFSRSPLSQLGGRIGEARVMHAMPLSPRRRDMSITLGAGVSVSAIRSALSAFHRIHALLPGPFLFAMTAL